MVPDPGGGRDRVGACWPLCQPLMAGGGCSAWRVSRLIECTPPSCQGRRASQGDAPARPMACVFPAPPGRSPGTSCYRGWRARGALWGRVLPLCCAWSYPRVMAIDTLHTGASGRCSSPIKLTSPLRPPQGGETCDRFLAQTAGCVRSGAARAKADTNRHAGMRTGARVPHPPRAEQGRWVPEEANH